MTDKQRGALAATMFCLAVIFGAMALHAAWNQVGANVALSVGFGTAFAILGRLAWSDKT